MANFVRIGKHLINLDRVTEIRDFMDSSRPRVAVCFGEDYSEFMGQDAEQLLGFVAQQQAMESLLVPERICHICEAKDALFCELCGENACDKHAEYRIVVGYDELKRCCDTCYFN